MLDSPFAIHHSGVIGDVFRLLRDVAAQDCKFYLFGSFARGEDRPSSDVDVAIDAGEPLPLIQMAKIRARLEDSNIPFTVEVVDLNRVSSPLREQIEKEAIPWID